MFSLIVTKAFSQTPRDAVALLSFRADASTSSVRKWCTTRDEYSNVNHNARVTSIAGVTSFADYALPSQVLQPRLPVQSGGPAEAGTHQGRDDHFRSFFSKYIFRSLVAFCGFFGWLDKILISTFLPFYLFHHHHHHQLLLHHHNTVTTIVISFSRQATVHYIYEREEDERTHPNPQAKKIFVMFDFPMLLQVSFSS